MTRILTESQAQADFSQLVTAACNGEDIIITRNNTPVVHFSGIAKPVAQESKQQTLVKKREKAIASIKEHHKGAIIGVPITMNEIISARDEGRKY